MIGLLAGEKFLSGSSSAILCRPAQNSCHSHYRNSTAASRDRSDSTLEPPDKCPRRLLTEELRAPSSEDDDFCFVEAEVRA